MWIAFSSTDKSNETKDSEKTMHLFLVYLVIVWIVFGSTDTSDETNDLKITMHIFLV